MSTKYIASNWRLPNKAGVDSYLNDNYGLTFDGNEYISCDNISELNNLTQASWCGWFNRGGSDTYCLMSVFGFSNSDRQLLIVQSPTTLTVSMGLGGAGNLRTMFENTSLTFTSDEWYHLAFVYNESESSNADKLKVYINNVLQTNENAGNAINQTNAVTGPFVIGARAAYFNQKFVGSISEVAAFNYALSSTQISTLYGSSSLGSASPLALKPAPVAFYPLGDNSSGNPLTQPNEAVEDASVFDFVPNDYIIADVDGTGGSDSSFELGSDLEFTVSFWFNRSSSSGQIGLFQWANVITSGSPFLLIQQNSNNLRAFYDGGYRTNIVTSQNIWYHITITRTASDNTLRGYLNGSEWFSYDDGGTPALQNVATNIYFGNGYQNYFTGQLSNGQIWNTALSSTEIETLYNSGVPLLTGTQPQASSLRAWYKLDQSANWEADSSGAWQIPDAVSAYPQSFNFGNKSEDEYIELPQLPSFTSITVSAWIKTQKTSTRQTIIGNNGQITTERGWDLRLGVWDGSGYSRAEFQFYNSGGSANTSVTQTLSQSLADNKWHHIAVLWDGTTDTNAVKIFVDGLFAGQGTSSFSGPISQPPATFEPRIGERGFSSSGGGGGWNFGGDTGEDGFISNVQIWNTSLTYGTVSSDGDTAGGQIAELYNNGNPLKNAIASDNLKAWYKLDNTATFSTNWSVPDASGNGNTGTSSGMTEQNLVNNNVSALNGESSGMTSANLVLTDLTRNLPYDSYSFEFDGSSDKITLNSSISTGNNYSVSFWLNPDNVASGNSYIFSDSTSSPFKGLALDQGSSTAGGFGNFYYYTGSVVIVNNTAVSGDVWSHIAIVFDVTAQEIKFYINGNLDKTTTSVANIGTLINEFGIRSTGNAFNGKLSNISVFNEELTSTEVMKLYSNGMPQDLSSFTPAPVAWWTLGSNSFFNGSNFICKDLIGSNDGTSVNAGVDALVGDTPRSEANGVATNQSIPENLVGTTKYSSNNSWSINMSESARVADTP